MVLREVVLARVASLLRPWLEDEASVEVRLGFLRSRITARRLRIKATSLDNLLSESLPMSFETATIDEIVVEFSLFTSPVLKIDVSGVHFSLQSRWKERSCGSGYSDETKKMQRISFHDPEGISLHSALEKMILEAMRPGKNVTNSFISIILEQCKASISDIDIQIQIPTNYSWLTANKSWNGVHSLCLSVSRFRAKGQHCGYLKLLKEIIRVLVTGRVVTNVIFKLKDLYVKLKPREESDRCSCILSLESLSLSLGMKKLQPSFVEIDIPELYIGLSYRDLSVIIFVHALFNSESLMMPSSDELPPEDDQGARSGKVLWKKTARQMHNRQQRFSFHKLVNLVILWQRYVHVYGSLLQQVGYPGADILFTARVRLSKDARLSKHMKHLWELASEMEKDLPAEGVALGRRMARHRSTVSHATSQSSDDSWAIYLFFIAFVHVLLRAPAFIIHLFIFAVNKLSYTFYYMCRFIWCRCAVVGWNLENTESHLLEGSFDFTKKYELDKGSRHITLDLSKLLVSISTSNIGYSNARETSAKGFPVDLWTFCLVLNHLHMNFASDDNMKHLMFACRELLAHSCTSQSTQEVESNTDADNPIKQPRVEKRQGNDHTSKTILSSSPALFSSEELDSLMGSNHSSGLLHKEVLKKHIAEIWLDWKNSSSFSKLKNIHSVERPFVLCGLTSFVINPYVSAGDRSLLKFGISMGKLIFELEISLLMIIYKEMLQLFGHPFYVERDVNMDGASHSSLDRGMQAGGHLEHQKFCANKVKMILSRIVTYKHMQIGAAIVGPSIQISGTCNDPLISEKQETVGRNIAQDHTPVIIALDVKGISSAFWPALSSVLTATEHQHVTSQYHWLKKPPVADIPKVSANENFIIQGKTAHNAFVRFEGLCFSLGSPAEDQRYDILLPLSASVECSICREYLHSLTTGATVLSMSLSGMSTPLKISTYTDEFELLQMLASSLYEVSRVSSKGLTCKGDDSSHDISLHRNMLTEQRKSAALKSQEDSGSFLVNGMKFVVDITLEFPILDVIVNKCKKNFIMQNFTSALKQNKQSLVCPDTCIKFCISNSNLRFFWEEQGSLCLLLDLGVIQSLIFRHESQVAKSYEKLEMKCGCFSDVLCELSLPNCRFHLRSALSSALSSGLETEGNTTSTSTSTFNNLCAARCLQLEAPSGSYSLNGCNSPDLNPDSSMHCAWLSSSTWRFLLSIELGEILMVQSSVKIVDLLPAASSSNFSKLEALFAVGEDCHSVRLEVQGGLLFLETKSLVVYISCLLEYALFFSRLFSYMPIEAGDSTAKVSVPMETAELSMPLLNRENVAGDAATFPSSSNMHPVLEDGLQSLEMLTIRLSQSCIKLITVDACVGAGELDIEIDFVLKYEIKNSRKNLVLDVARAAILGLKWQRTSDCVHMEVHVPQFHSSTLSAGAGSGQTTHTFEGSEMEVLDCSQRKFTNNSEYIRSYRLTSKNFILEHMTTSLSIDKELPGMIIGSIGPKDGWGGHASVSGLNLKMTVSQIQLVSSLLEDVQDISSLKSKLASKDEANHTILRGDEVLEDITSSGIIVAIQDLEQHMYFTVESIHGKHRLVGALHYSLVGERALFRVQYCNQKKGFSSVSCFSLISLHAKNDKGEPLRVNFKPGCMLVDLSGTDDKAGSLWQAISYKPASYEGHGGFEARYHSPGRAFYLLNFKYDFAVAFVDGLPEFVKKPGNLFKMKIFSTSPRMHQVSFSEIPSTSLGNISDSDTQGISVQDISSRYVDILIDRVSLTVLHEVSDANDSVPLLRVCVDNLQPVVQILYSKTRIITSLTILMETYDCSCNIWREVVSPVKICIYCRSSANLDTKRKGVLFNLYCRIRKIEVALRQLSLDILLLVVGKLGLAGPYAVGHSIILSNCKVKNFSGVNLLFSVDNHETTIAANQSSNVALRNLDKASVYLQLALGEFVTSPIHVALSNAGTRAWRTRLAHRDASRTSPGPLVVVEVVKQSQNGLSVAVYPMLKIHNEAGLSLELRCRRPQEAEDEFVIVPLKSGDYVDDSVAAFESLGMSGLAKRSLTSLSLGNFLLSIKPKASEVFQDPNNQISVEWSEDLKGEKSLCLSGLFDILNYQLKKGFGGKSVKVMFNTIRCCTQSRGRNVSDVHFLVQSIGREVPVLRPYKEGVSEMEKSAIAIQEQKEIFLLPTVQVYNVLESEILVLLSENLQETCIDTTFSHGKWSTIRSGSSAHFYVNPSIIYFRFILTELNVKCKPINSGDLVKKLKKKKSDHFLDIDLEFDGGNYVARLRLSRSDRGILEATIFTSYVLKNGTDLSFFCGDASKKPLLRGDIARYWSTCPPEIGFVLPPDSTKSWFFKSNKVQLISLKHEVNEAALKLDSLSGFTEIKSEVFSEDGMKHIMKFGISLQPILSKVLVASQFVHIVPRYVVVNESEDDIFVRQSLVYSDDLDGIKVIGSNQRAALQMWTSEKRRELGIVDTVFQIHRNDNDDSLLYIQLCLKQDEWSWSGPICVGSLGHFFLKFNRKTGGFGPFGCDLTCYGTSTEKDLTRVGTVDIAEEESMIVIHFRMPSNVSLPYRIENALRDASIIYHQKGMMDQETLEHGRVVDYVWDDLTLPHTLVVHIADVHLECEINIDKLSAWKPFYKVRQAKGVMFHSLDDGGAKDAKRARREASFPTTGIFKLGYKVYADGAQRVLRISEMVGNLDGTNPFSHHPFPHKKFKFRLSFFAIHFLEDQEDVEANEAAFLQARTENVSLESIFADQQICTEIRIQSVHVDEKWQGAPFAAMLRRHQLDNNDVNDYVLRIGIIFNSANASFTEVRYCSVVVQPLDVNLDEETLMKLVPFWRTSLGDSKSKIQKIYFKYFEIHPIKVIASFLPGNPTTSYSSSQEALRSLLHSIIKIPTVKAAVVELNGVLLTHALLATRELFVKCMQHYSWYAMRAVYIAKGSAYLPPSFASIFDDSASSSLDVFFDPSSKLHNLPGLTLGMFKFISKCVENKGFSGTRRYLGDLGKTLKRAGSTVLFAAITEISDSVVRGAETSGVSGMAKGFHQGILNLAMEPALIGSAFMEGGPNRRINLDRSPGTSEAYVEGYLQAMLDVLYKLAYLKVKVIDDQVILKNLPPNSSLINDILEHVNGFLISEGLLKGESNAYSLSTRQLYGGNEWKIGPTLLTLTEHLFVSFAIRFLRQQASKVLAHVKWLPKSGNKAIVPASLDANQKRTSRKQALSKFVLSSVLAYIDGRLCRCIPNTITRRIVSGFLLSFLDQNDKK